MPSPRLPRVILVRHGKTEWSVNGRYTGRTDLSLLPGSAEKVVKTVKFLEGGGEKAPIDWNSIEYAFVSPKKRARETWDAIAAANNVSSINVAYEDDLQEWHYGDYEGLTYPEIIEKRNTDLFNLYVEGCPNGETPEEVQTRIDRLITKIRELQNRALAAGRMGDVIIVGHGDTLTCFMGRWVKENLSVCSRFTLEAGAACALSYRRSLNRPIISLWNFNLDYLNLPDTKTEDERKSSIWERLSKIYQKALI